MLVYTGVGLSSLGSVASFLAGCAKRRLGGEPFRTDRYGMTILVDGFRADLFRDLLASGGLPNIKKHLVDRGTLVETCVSTFPSTTGPAHLPFITGVMPGLNNCPGLRWVDRRHRALRDYCTIHNVLFNTDFPGSNYTLYEILSGAKTACIFDFVSRGASDPVTVPAKSLWFLATGEMDVWRKMDGYAVDAFYKVSESGGGMPRYSFVWMPAIDHLGHFHGSKNQVILDRVVDIDKQIGRLMARLQDHGVYDETLVSMVVDHGLSDTDNHLDLKKVLGKYGFKVLEDLTENDQFNSLYQNNAARGVSGNAFALLYFAPRKEGRLDTVSYDWGHTPSYEELRHFPVSSSGGVDIIDLLRKEQGIELVMAKEGADTFRIFSRNGESKIERDLASLRYSYAETDPMGYAEIPEVAVLIDGAYHSKDEWFMATRSTRFPDGIFQIAQLFDSERCGDVVVTAESGWDLMDQGHKASHGGLDRAQIEVPCVVAGPGVKQGTIPIARNVDLYPTYLEFLGIPSHDGEVLNVFM